MFTMNPADSTIGLAFALLKQLLANVYVDDHGITHIHTKKNVLPSE